MRIRQAELWVDPGDVAEWLAPHAASHGVSDLSLSAAAGELRVNLRWGRGPVRVPVALIVTVADVRPDALELAVDLRAILPVPGMAVDRVLAALVEGLGVESVQPRGRRIHVDVDSLSPNLGAWFRLRRVTLAEGGIVVEVEDLVLLPRAEVPAALPGTVVPPAEPPAMPDVPAAAQPAEYRDAYDSLRRKVEAWAGRKVPERYRPLVPWLLLLPDLFALLCRLAVDRRVPAADKALLGLVIAYVIAPIDLIPDLVPVIGVTDDLALVLLMLARLVEHTPPAVLRENWAGRADLAEVIQRGAGWAGTVLPGSLYTRLKGMLRGGGTGSAAPPGAGQ